MRNRKLKPLVALAALLWAGSVAGQSQGLRNIGTFVRQPYAEGVPFTEARRYGGPAVSILLRMLRDPREQPYWSNIVTTLGMIGGKRAVEPLIGFIEKEVRAGARARSREQDLNRGREQAKKSAITSLGYLINRSKSRRALDYLISRAFLWTLSAQDSERSLSKYAIQGLALSGSPEAAGTLRSLQRSLRPKDPLRADVDEALRTNQEIAAKGLVRYLRGSRF